MAFQVTTTSARARVAAQARGPSANSASASARLRLGARHYERHGKDLGRFVVANAGKGFGKKSNVEPQGEVKDKASEGASTSFSQQKPPPPQGNFGDSSWASEVRSQEAYDTSSSSEEEVAQPPRIPAAQYKKIDENFVTGLAFIFVAIFVEGLLVAGSGFLPEEVDQFIVNTIFPAFTPTLGLFLLVSVFYGLFKSKVEPE